MNRSSAVAGGIFVGASVLVVGGILLLAADGGPSGDSDTSSGSSSAAGLMSPTPTPTGPSMAELRALWAGDVCTARDSLRAQVTALGSDLDLELGPDVLADLESQIRTQLMEVSSAAGELVGVLVTAPVEPAQLDSWITTVQGPQQDLQEAVDVTRGHLDTMTSASGILEGVGAAGEVVSSGAAAVAAGQDLLAAVQSVYDQAQTEFAPSFAQAPECQTTS